MGNYSQKLNLANFICKFGEKFVLLDLADEIVIPAFTDESFKRKYADTNYFFHGVELINLSTSEKNEMAIAGRLVKETTVSRSQILKDGEIIKDYQELSSAPTSFFVLLLSNHKLLFVRENSGAPSIQIFESTILSFLKLAHRKWIDLKFNERNDEAPIKKNDLYNEWPSPTLEIVPLASEETINAYVDKFKVINSVEIQLLNTNHETDNSPLFRSLRSVKGDTGADKLSIKTQKTGTVGLEKAEVTKLISGQAQEGNSRITLQGEGLAGDKMKTMNTEFYIAIPVTTLKENVGIAAASLVDTLNRHVSQGAINLREVTNVASAKFNNLMRKLTNNGI